MCPLLRPHFYQEEQFFFKENESISDIFFVINGQGNFVLPRYKNAAYISIKKGNHFGIIDIVGSCFTQDIPIEDWFSKRSLLLRQFSIMAETKSEVLCLSIQQLQQMKMEFNESYEDLFFNASQVVKNTWVVKLEAIKECNQIKREIEESMVKSSRRMSGLQSDQNSESSMYCHLIEGV